MERLYREPPQTYTVTVHSDDDNAANFYVRLPKPLALGSGFYEVALQRIQIVKQSIPAGPYKVDTGSEPAEEQKRARVENKVFRNYVEPEVQYFQYLYQTKTSLLELYLHFRAQFRLKGFPVTLTPVRINDREVVTKLHVEHWDVTKYVILDPFLVSVLGFSRRTFYLGTFMGAEVVNEEALSLLNPAISYDNAVITFTSRDNVIELDNIYEEIVVLVLEQRDFETFLQTCVTTFVELGYEVMFALLPDNKVVMRFDSVNAGDEYVILPSNLMQCFGFDGNGRFAVGTFTSDRPCDENTFMGFATGQKFQVRAGRHHTQLIAMREPSVFDYAAVLQEINNSFVRSNVDDIRPVFKIEDGKIFAESLMEYASIRLPASVNAFFGLNEDQQFTVDTRIPVGPEINLAERRVEVENSEKNVESDFQVNSESNSQDVLVLLDCLEGQIYGNRIVPVLDQISGDINTGLNFENRSLIYLPLLCQDVDHFRVTITNKKLQELFLPGYYTVLSLHFRPRVY